MTTRRKGKTFASLQSSGSGRALSLSLSFSLISIFFAYFAHHDQGLEKEGFLKLNFTRTKKILSSLRKNTITFMVLSLLYNFVCLNLTHVPQSYKGRFIAWKPRCKNESTIRANFFAILRSLQCKFYFFSLTYSKESVQSTKNIIFGRFGDRGFKTLFFYLKILLLFLDS